MSVVRFDGEPLGHGVHSRPVPSETHVNAMPRDVKLDSTFVRLVGLHEDADAVVARRGSQLQALLPRSGNRVAGVQHRVDQHRADRVGLKFMHVPESIRIGMIDEQRGDFTVGPDKTLGSGKSP